MFLKQRQQQVIMASMAVMVTLFFVVTEGGDGTLYKLGEAGRRGTAVIASFDSPSITLCAAGCLSGTGCVAFNWMVISASCQTLSSLRTVTNDPASSIYVPEVKRVSIQLHFSCAQCHGSKPFGVEVWEMQCPRPGGVVVGVVASVTLIDLDYLVCAYPANLTLDYSAGCVHTDGNSCNGLLDAFVMTAVWANSQDFRSPSSFAYQGIRIFSGGKLDMGRCVTPKEDVGPVSGVTGNHFHCLLCPPHMMAVSLAWLDPTSAPVLICCLLY